ncbi:unnamed protein product [Orchesella dallaii]|uniref:Histone-binding protein RBBP4-like N-terminal domain-containing protein n=1 Tax=Orchesella dallaii TaxID=48710 RepID=A0ABP1QEK7_9HEXA
MKATEGAARTTSGEGIVHLGKRENGGANGVIPQLNGFAAMEQKLELNGNKKPDSNVHNGMVVVTKTEEEALMGGIEDITISDVMDVDEEVAVGVSGNGNVTNGAIANGNSLSATMEQDPMNGMINAPPPPLHAPKCSNGKQACVLDGSPSFPCKRCHRIFYCSEDHRRQHCDEHQPDCKTVSSLEVICYEEEYSMWLKHAAPHLYDVCLNFVLVWPSLTVQWLPEIVELENNIIRHHLLLGTMTNQEQNHLLICGIDVPERTKTDNVSDHAAKYKGTMYVLKRINHEAEVNRARYMPQDSNIVATKSSSPEVFIFDCSKYPEVPEDSKFSPLLRLRGHQKEGFGLSWNLKEKGKLLSGSYDALICLWDLNKSSCTENNVKYLNACRTFRAHEDVVEDVDWHPEQKHLFASVGDDKRLILWDTRGAVSEEAVFIGKDVHERDVNAVSFSPFSEFALATGSSDCTVAVWDMRNMSRKVHSLEFHRAEVMQVQWSPHNGSILASTGKDNRVFIWDLAKSVKGDPQSQIADDDPAPNELVFIHGGHVSNVNDISWNLHETGMISSVTEDNILQVWKVAEDLQAVHMADGDSDEESGESASEILDD